MHALLRDRVFSFPKLEREDEEELYGHGCPLSGRANPEDIVHQIREVEE